MSTNEKCNGWSSYATWRVNLDLWGDYTGAENIGNWDSVVSLADWLEESTDDILTQHGAITDGLALDYARTFVEDVNFYEIAQAIVASHPEVLIIIDENTGDNVNRPVVLS